MSNVMRAIGWLNLAVFLGVAALAAFYLHSLPVPALDPVALTMHVEQRSTLAWVPLAAVAICQGLLGWGVLHGIAAVADNTKRRPL